MAFNTYTSLNYPINVPRLFADLAIKDADLRRVAALDIPGSVGVTSGSVIKTGTVEDVLRIVCPNDRFEVFGGKFSSGVAEQPLGQTTIDGALNRLRNASHRHQSAATAWFSIENGLFRVAPRGALLKPASKGRIRQFTERADLSPQFDPDAEYEDRAVAAIHIPGYPTIVQISPASEAVRFPKEAVLAAHNAQGGFEKHTAGSKLAEMKIVKDKQNPHLELTVGRSGGPLARPDQMARVMIRALLRAGT